MAIEKTPSRSLDEIEKRILHFANQSISPRTRAAYESDWDHFHRWCVEIGYDSLPAAPSTVGAYLTELADDGMSVATIARRQTSISQIHEAGGHLNPTKTSIISRVMKGIKRQYGKPADQARSISWSELQRMIGLTDITYMGLRDASLLSLGWTAAMRRSEIVALRLSDVQIDERGAILTICRSKTDQSGEGRAIGIPRARRDCCPVALLERWIDRRTSPDPQDPLYTAIGVKGMGAWTWDSKKPLVDRMISRIVKRYGELIGLPTSEISAHSLRRGLATEAGARGVPERIIARHTRHRSMAVLRGYIDEGTIWEENPLLAIYSPAGCTSSDEL